jgi:predicted transposase/invertase (TIGR01784 family)
MTSPNLPDKTENKIHHAHDKAFQSAMSDLRVARDFLQHHLPVAIQEQIDLATLQLHSTHFIDPELRRLTTDMLYSADFKDHPQQAFLYLCVEQERNADPLMAFRLIKYICRIIDQYLKGKKKTPLPVVIPLLVHNGDTKYPYSCSIFDCFGEHKALAQQFMFNTFELVDLTQLPDEVIRQHQWSGFLEMLFKHVAARDIMVYLEQLSEIVERLVAAHADDYLLTMIKYLIEKSEIPNREVFQTWVHTHLSPPLEVKTMTLAEQFRMEGRMEGKMEGEQTMLIEQLNYRFSSLRPDYESKIKNAQADDLLLWGKRVLSAKSVEEVFQA